MKRCHEKENKLRRKSKEKKLRDPSIFLKWIFLNRTRENNTKETRYFFKRDVENIHKYQHILRTFTKRRIYNTKW